MSGGVVTGGWGFVIAAYSLTAVLFLGYTISIYSRFRAEKERFLREQRNRSNEVTS